MIRRVTVLGLFLCLLTTLGWWCLQAKVPSSKFQVPSPLKSETQNSKRTTQNSADCGQRTADSGQILNSLEGRPAFRVYSDKDGLPQNTIRSLAFDQKGYLWAGTQDGAAYYNGRYWTPVNMPNRASSNRVYAIVADSGGGLWFGTDGGGLVHFENGTWNTFHTKNSGVPSNRIYCLLETTSPEGTHSLWVGTYGNGLARYEQGRWTTFDMKNCGLPNNNITSLAETVSASGRRTLWVATGQGLACYEDHHWRTFDTTNSGLPNNQVLTLLPTATPTASLSLWVGTDGGLTHLEEVRSPKSEVRSPESQEEGEKAKRQKDEKELAATDGLRAADSQDSQPSYRWTNFSTQNSSLPNNSVWGLAQTVDANHSPTLWVATLGGGLTRLEEVRRPPSAIRRPPPATQNSDSVLSPQPSALWRWTTFTEKNSGLPTNTILRLFKTVSPAGISTLWLATGSGVVRFQEGGWTALDDKNSGLPENEVLSLLETFSANGSPTFWVGTVGGLACWEAVRRPPSEIEAQNSGPQTADRGPTLMASDGRWKIFNTHNSGLPNDHVRCLAESISDSGRRGLWVGTYGGGLAHYAQDQWTIYDTANSKLPNNSVWTLLETLSSSGNRKLWVGTNGGGLACLERGQWTIFQTGNSPLPDDRVDSLLETTNPDHTHTLWIGTAGGLARLDEVPQKSEEEGEQANRGSGEKESKTQNSKLKTQNSYKWTVLTTENSGLPNNRIHSLRETVSADQTRYLWVGTANGGLARWNLTATKPEWIIFSETTTPALPNNTIYQIVEDARQRIYLSTNKGIVRLTPNRQTPGNSSDYSIVTFTTEDGLPNNQCSWGAVTLMADGSGHLWAGTLGGIAIFDPTLEIADHTPKPLRIEQLLVNGTTHPTATNAGFAYNQNNFVFAYALLNYFRESETRYRIQLEGFEPDPSDWISVANKEYTNLGEGSYRFKIWGKDYAGNVSGPVTYSFTIRPAPWRTWWAYLLYGATLALGVYGGVRVRLQALHRQNQILEARIALRTAELAKSVRETEKKNEELKDANERMRQAKGEIEQKNHELDKKVEELIISQRQANRIFSALAEALPGTVLDSKYRLEEKIGTGGFGAVFRATHLLLNHEVAVKVFRPTPGNDSPKAVERFRLEGVTATRVNHPNAISVLDSGISSEGVAYLVMELLNGRTLTQELRSRQRISLKRCAEIVVPVCQALTEAHTVGIIHRDIKPDNIFLHQSKDGEVVKVVDFGIAKLMGENTGDHSHELTMTGSLIGTPTYMAPERLNNKPYDGRADVYSLGVTLYAMLCGRVPFQTTERSLIEVILMHIREEPPPLRVFNPSIPEEVAKVVMRALEKDPALRPTAGELAEEFAAAVANCPEDVQPGSQPFLVTTDDTNPDESQTGTINQDLSQLTTGVIRSHKLTK